MADIITDILYGDSKECPKKERCKYGDNCNHTDTFKGDRLCFERKRFNGYENMEASYNRQNGGNNDKDRKC